MSKITQNILTVVARNSQPLDDKHSETLRINEEAVERIFSLPSTAKPLERLHEFVSNLGYQGVVDLIAWLDTSLSNRRVRAETSKGRKYMKIIDTLVAETAMGLEYERLSSYLFGPYVKDGLTTGIYDIFLGDAPGLFGMFQTALEEYSERIQLPARRIIQEFSANNNGLTVMAWKEYDVRDAVPLTEVWLTSTPTLEPIVSPGAVPYSLLNISEYPLVEKLLAGTEAIYLYDILSGLRELGNRKANTNQETTPYKRQSEKYKNIYDILIEESLLVLTLPFILVQQAGFDVSQIKDKAAATLYANIIAFQSYFIEKIKEISEDESSAYLLVHIFSPFDNTGIGNLGNIIKYHLDITDNERLALRDALLNIAGTNLDRLDDSQDGIYYKQKIELFLNHVFYETGNFAEYASKTLMNDHNIGSNIDWEYSFAGIQKERVTLATLFQDNFKHLQSLVRTAGDKLVFQEFPPQGLLAMLNVTDLELTTEGNQIHVVLSTASGYGVKKSYMYNVAQESKGAEILSMVDLGIQAYLQAYAQSVPEAEFDLRKREMAVPNYPKMWGIYYKNGFPLTLYSNDFIDFVDPETAEVTIVREKISLVL